MQRRVTVLIVVLLCMAAGMRAEAQPVPATLHACVTIASEKERLRCFDHEMAQLEAASTRGEAPASNASKANTLPPAVTAPAVAVAANPTIPSAAALPPEQTFGLSGDQILKLESRQAGSPAPQPKLKNLTAQITRVTQNSQGRWVITLNNGQVWRQSETREFQASPGLAVKISSGAMGSYWLETNSHNWTRVERVL